MATIPYPTNTAQFDAALTDAARRATAHYPAEKCRIARGCQIAQADGVELYQDGSATVQSQTQPEVRYHVNGHCPCPDAMRAPAGRCKHRWSKALYKAALAAVKRHPGKDRWYATYTAPSGEQVVGMAEWQPDLKCWLFVPEFGQEPAYIAKQALSFGGHVGMAEDQQETDGDLGVKCGLPQYPTAAACAAMRAELASLRTHRTPRSA